MSSSWEGQWAREEGRRSFSNKCPALPRSSTALGGAKVSNLQDHKADGELAFGK